MYTKRNVDKFLKHWYSMTKRNIVCHKEYYHVVYCGSLFGLLSFLFWPYNCLSFDLWLMIIPLGIFNRFLSGNIPVTNECDVCVSECIWHLRHCFNYKNCLQLARGLFKFWIGNFGSSIDILKRYSIALSRRLLNIKRLFFYYS